MTTAAPTGEPRRGFRRWRRSPAVLTVGPLLLLFGLSNLWLASPWGRGWIGGKVTAATGLETTIAGASWSPWNGATLRGIRIAQPSPLAEMIREPLAEIGAIRLTPVWGAWLRGHLVMREIDLHSPRIVLPVQILSHFMEQAAPLPAPAAADPEPGVEPAPGTDMPPIASLTTAPEPPEPAITPAPPDEPTPPAAIVEIPPPADAVDQEVASAAPAPPADAPAAAEPEAPPLPDALAQSGLPEPNGWIRITNGSFKLVFAGVDTALLDLEHLDAAIPVSGGPADSQMRLGPLAILGQEVLDGLDLPLRWEGQLLSFGPVETESSGVLIQLGGRLAFGNGMPLEFEVLLPDQNPPDPIDVAGHAVHPARLAAALRFQGPLLVPAAWQGEALASANDIVVTRLPRETTDGFQPQTEFARGGGVVIMSGGVLSCLDARLIGDGLSFLGNGTRLADGRTAAVLRIVAPPANAAELSRRFFPWIEDPPALTALSTPQRAALDMQLFGSSDGMLLRLGHHGPLIDLQEILAGRAPSP